MLISGASNSLLNNKTQELFSILMTAMHKISGPLSSQDITQLHFLSRANVYEISLSLSSGTSWLVIGIQSLCFWWHLSIGVNRETQLLKVYNPLSCDISENTFDPPHYDFSVVQTNIMKTCLHGQLATKTLFNFIPLTFSFNKDVFQFEFVTVPSCGIPKHLLVSARETQMH